MSQTPSEAEDALDPLLEALLSQTPEEERAALNSILEVGLDQGWFVRVNDGDVLNPTPDHAAALHQRAGERRQVSPTMADPWSDLSPSGQAIEEDATGWVVISQRCDLVRCYSAEPLVQVARAVLLGDADGAPAARSNSPRLVAFAEASDGRVWAADLRQRGVLPKHLLAGASAVPAILSERERKRFRLRLGQRYWRDPVPDDLVESLQRPLIDAVRRSSRRVALFANFAMWLGQRAGGHVLVVAVAEHGCESEAEEDWHEVMELLRIKEVEAFALIEPEESGVVSADDVPLGFWLESFKFDFDELTYGRRARDDHAAPSL